MDNAATTFVQDSGMCTAKPLSTAVNPTQGLRTANPAIEDSIQDTEITTVALTGGEEAVLVDSCVSLYMNTLKDDATGEEEAEFVDNSVSLGMTTLMGESAGREGVIFDDDSVKLDMEAVQELHC